MVMVGIGVNSTTVNSAVITIPSGVSAPSFGVPHAHYNYQTLEGRTYMPWLEFANSANPGTFPISWAGNSNAGFAMQSGMYGFIWS